MKPLQIKLVTLAVFGLGLALLVYGVGCYSRPAGFIVAGVMLALGAALVMGVYVKREG